MRFVVFVVLLALSDVAQAQIYRDPSRRRIDYNYEYNPDEYKRKYPYVKKYTPRFLGLVVGANLLNQQQVELGLTYNLVNLPTTYGMTGGYQLIYKRAIERDLNTVDLELGIYGLLSLGVGVNYTFSEEASVVGFKPLIGTSFYHVQVLYGYNCISKKKQEWYDLSRHSLSIRYVLPFKASKQTHYSLPDKPNYQNLPRLNDKHPVQEPTQYNRRRGAYREW